MISDTVPVHMKEIKEEPAVWKLYKRRWIIMILFMMYTIDGAVQWAQFTIISNLVSKYYNVSETFVEWTANVYMLYYVLFIIPSLYVLDKLGLRRTMIIASLGMTAGTWIKVASVAPDRFLLVMIGQSFEAFFLLLTFGLAARFTAVWFGAKEISMAGSLALFGDILGSSMAFLLPSVFVKDGTILEIGNGLLKMHITIAALSTVICVLVTLFFEEKPKIPPSAAQIKQKEYKNEPIHKTLLSVIRLPPFILILLSYGWCVGSFNAVITLLNQTLLANYPGRTDDAGNIGFIIMISGIFSSLIIGRILDKTKRFKENAVCLTMGSVLSMIFFTWSLKSNNILFVYCSAILFGIFSLGYYATGAQIGIEATYPVSEGVSSAIMLLSTQGHGIVITTIYGYTVKEYGDLASNIGLVITFTLSCIFAILIPNKLKRQDAEKRVPNKVDELKEFL